MDRKRKINNDYTWDTYYYIRVYGYYKYELFDDSMVIIKIRIKNN